MEHHKTFNYFEQKTIDNAGKLYKQYLINGNIDNRSYNSLSNNFRKELSSRINEIFPVSNRKLYSYLTVFKNGYSDYKCNAEENVLKNELFLKFKKGSIRKELTYKELVFKIAIYRDLNKAYSIISSKSSFYSLIYDKNEFKRYIFTYDFNSINKAEQKLLNKYYPKRGGNIIDFDSLSNNAHIKTNEKNRVKKVNDDIDLFGVRFNLNEFALYNREWKNFKKHTTVSFKDIFDKVMMDFNDPYNYIKSNRSYDGTPFYKALQEDKPIDKKNYSVELAYNKILNLAKKTGNDKFLKFIEVRKALIKN